MSKENGTPAVCSSSKEKGEEDDEEAEHTGSIEQITAVKKDGGRKSSPNKNRPNSSPAISAVYPDAASVMKPNANPKKRPHNPPRSPRQSSLTDNDTTTGTYGHVMNTQHSIEMITRKEALRHVEMAWRAQQRLVRRCLALRHLGETPSTDTGHVNNAVGEDSNAAKLNSK